MFFSYLFYSYLNASNADIFKARLDGYNPVKKPMITDVAMTDKIRTKGTLLTSKNSPPLDIEIIDKIIDIR